MTDAMRTLEELTTKAKIGLVVVSASTVSELRYPKVAPEVGFFASRMMLGGDGGLEALLEMELNSSRAVQELASAGVDSIAYCCTVSGAQRGLEKDREFCDDMERQFGAPTTSTMLAAAEALQHLGIRRVVLTSPYPHSYHEAESRYLAEAGIETVASSGMGFVTAAEFAAVPPAGNLQVHAGSLAGKRRRCRRAIRKLHELRRDGCGASAGGCDRQAGGDFAYGDAVAGTVAGGGQRAGAWLRAIAGRAAGVPGGGGRVTGAGATSAGRSAVSHRTCTEVIVSKSEGFSRTGQNGCGIRK